MQLQNYHIISNKAVALSGTSDDLLDAFDDGFDGQYSGDVTITSGYNVSQLITTNAATAGGITLSDVTVALSGSSSDLVDAFAGTVTQHNGDITVTSLVIM